MKICARCGISTDNFGPDIKSKDGLHSRCRICKNNYLKMGRKTMDGLVSESYGHQRSNSKRRGHGMPIYTKKELCFWLKKQNNFQELYNNRVQSGYDKMKKPSIDRIDNNKGYSFDNIQLMTWQENKDKSHKDMREGRLINGSRPQKRIKGISNSSGEQVEFHSMNEAQRSTGIDNSNISRCCNGKQKTAGGYIWKYN